MATLINATKNPARVLGFLGGARRGGFTLIPGPDRFATTAEQDQLLRSSDKTIKFYIEQGDVVDVHNTLGFNEGETRGARASAAAAVSHEEEDTSPARPQPATKARRGDFVPPVPTPVAVAPVVEDEAPTQVTAPSAPHRLSRNLDNALTQVVNQEDIEVLKAWHNDEKRAEVRTAIEARGNTLLALAAAKQ